METIKRQTAYKSNISTINKGIFVKKQGWESSYIMTEYGDFSRVNIIGIIVEKNDNNIIIEDGTGRMSVRFFDGANKTNDMLNKVNVGEVIIVVGRPREYNNEIYVTGELVKKIDGRWANYRRKELSLVQKIRDTESINKFKTSESRTKENFEEQESTSTLNSKDKLVEIIRKLDNGDGAEFDAVIRFSKIGNAEDFITDMLMKGEIFEVRPGFLKLM